MLLAAVFGLLLVSSNRFYEKHLIAVPGKLAEEFL